MRWLLLSLALCHGAPHATEPDPGARQDPPMARDAELIRVGHWVQVKGSYLGGGDFVAEKLELLEPDSTATLVGLVERVVPERERMWVNGQIIRTSSKTELGELSLSELQGQLVKVQGRYHGPRNFAAREISLRQKGRASLEGRVDHIRTTSEGREALIFNVRVLLPPDASLEFVEGFEELELAPLNHTPAAPDRRFVGDQEESIPGSIHLTDTLRFGALYEVRGDYEDNFNLDDTDHESRRDYQGSVVGELRWQPRSDFTALVRGRGAYRYRMDQDKPDEVLEDLQLAEAWVSWSDILGSGAELQVGRQDFDDPREWLYDHNLDAARLSWSRSALRVELSASTVLADGSNRDEHSDNFIAYLSNNDRDRHVAAYVIDRRDARSPREYPIHFGVRALGEWLPDNDSWLEYSVLRGYANNQNLEGWALDLGTTWEPGFLEPFYVTLGYATSTGDDPATPNVDESFRQTGFQDNNAKFGGVTSLRYYGELVDPELSNLEIATLGLGLRFTRDVSLDLIYHDYRLAEPALKIRDTQIATPMDGVHRGFGEELDLVLGVRRWNGFDLKLSASHFEPGSAFPAGDDAFQLGLRLRYRF